MSIVIGVSKTVMLKSAQNFARLGFMPEWASWSVEEASKQTGYNKEYIRVLIRDKKIEAEKFGTAYVVKRDSLLEYIKQTKRDDDRRTGPQKHRD